MANKCVVYGHHHYTLHHRTIYKTVHSEHSCHLEFLHNRKFVCFQLGVYKFSKNLGPTSKFRMPEGWREASFVQNTRRHRYFCTELGCCGSQIPRILAQLVSAEVYFLFVQVSLRQSFHLMTILKIFFGMLLIALHCHLIFSMKEHVISLSSSSVTGYKVSRLVHSSWMLLPPSPPFFCRTCLLPAEIYCTLTWEFVYSFILNVLSIYVIYSNCI